MAGPAYDRLGTSARSNVSEGIFVQAGKNYGWPVVTKARHYRTEAMYGDARSREGYMSIL